MATLKEQKELFVTGFEGTSPQELLLICSTAPIGCFFYLATASATRTPTTAKTNSIDRRSKILLEFVSFVVPMILCQTNRLYPWGVSYLTLQLVVASMISFSRWRRTQREQQQPAQRRIDSRRAALTVYRASMLFLTFVAILAVDFSVFPRRLVKTEVRGYSLMDLGAASFVIAAGIVSPRSRHKKVSINAARILPLLLMGVLRLLTHKGIDYQEHASEYGVHWNFFFTLALLSPVASLLPGPSLWVPCLIMGMYQYILSFQGLQEWVEEAPRTCGTSNGGNLLFCDLLVANREGLLGCVGYTALYLMSEWIAWRVFWHKQSSSPSILGLVTLTVGAAWRVLICFEFDVSRRTTNPTFCIWALFVNFAQLSAIWIVYEHSHSLHVPVLADATNQNGLIVFVVANLLTGLVNLTVNTLAVKDLAALGILTLYTSMIGAASLFADVLRTRQKTGALKSHAL